MKLALLALSLAPAAYAAPRPRSPKVVMQETKADLEAMAKELNPIVGFYDPLGLSSASFWGKSEAETIGFLRHSRSSTARRHGRVLRLLHPGERHPLPWTPFRGFEESVSSMTPRSSGRDPANAKLQIIAWVGFLEFYSEIAGTHYMKGGVPGKFPSFKETAIANILPVDLYDPTNVASSMSAEESKKGLQAEINNGRLAMLGIFGFLTEAKIPGAVPALSNIVKPYAGDVMAPFAANAHCF
ncbi:chlorophyll A-B binding protein [Aureococcus anophagefferens]|nr:chlorophyll A-B binding protein [Aureococcus anophagefferens]